MISRVDSVFDWNSHHKILNCTIYSFIFLSTRKLNMLWINYVFLLFCGIYIEILIESISNACQFHKPMRIYMQNNFSLRLSIIVMKIKKKTMCDKYFTFMRCNYCQSFICNWFINLWLENRYRAIWHCIIMLLIKFLQLMFHSLKNDTNLW